MVGRHAGLQGKNRGRLGTVTWRRMFLSSLDSLNSFSQKLPASNRYKLCSPVMLYSSTTVPSDT
jgi:hypothetical protein